MRKHFIIGLVAISMIIVCAQAFESQTEKSAPEAAAERPLSASPFTYSDLPKLEALEDELAECVLTKRSGTKSPPVTPTSTKSDHAATFSDERKRRQLMARISALVVKTRSGGEIDESELRCKRELPSDSDSDECESPIARTRFVSTRSAPPAVQTPGANE